MPKQPEGSVGDGAQASESGAVEETGDQEVPKVNAEA
jgi:hypothetical protein